MGAEFTQGGQLRTVRAEREVVLSSGAIKSPQLLLLSGIGPADQLQRLGIKVLIDSARVGTNFQNHISYHVQYATSEGSSSYRYLKPANAAKAGLDYLLFRKGALAESAVAMFGCWRSDSSLKVPDSHVTAVCLVPWTNPPAFPGPEALGAAARRTVSNVRCTSLPLAGGRCVCVRAIPATHR